MTTHEITWKHILNQLVKHQNLTDTEVAWAMDHIMTGQTEQPILASFLTALHSKGETPEELGALATGMIAKAETVDINPHAVDIVGTGGDQQNTVNISTMAALVIAGTGATVVNTATAPPPPTPAPQTSSKPSESASTCPFPQSPNALARPASRSCLR